jgi:hypothetical protein
MSQDRNLHRCRACGELVRLQEDVRDLLEVPCICIACGRETAYSKVGHHLPLWTIYARPRDFPQGFVARLFLDGGATTKTLTAPSLAAIRGLLPRGLTCLARSPQDDPVIVETWL